MALKAPTGNPVLDFILVTAETNKVEAGEMMVQSLMAGDPATLKLGYTFANALLGAVKMLDLTTQEAVLVAGRLYEAKG